MRLLNSRHLIAGLFFLFVLSCTFPSCATTRQSKIDAQRRGLMMQDKAEYSRNRKFKSSKAFRKQKRRSAQYRKSRIRR